MPEVGKIQSTNFQALLRELGIVRNDVPFALRSEVTPVVLVGGTVSFIAPPTPAYRVTDIFTAGLTVAPAGGTVLADTGPLPAGAYGVTIIFNATENARWQIEWRNATDTANLVVHEVDTPAPALSNGQIIWQAFRFDVLNANERFRVLNSLVGAAGQRYQATIFART